MKPIRTRLQEALIVVGVVAFLALVLWCTYLVECFRAGIWARQPRHHPGLGGEVMDHPVPAPSWITHPQTGLDTADSKAIAAAIDALDAISHGHRTDAFRILSVRYCDDLERTVREDLHAAWRKQVAEGGVDLRAALANAFGDKPPDGGSEAKESR